MNRKDFLKHLATGAVVAPTMLNGFNLTASNTSPFAHLLEDAGMDSDKVLVLIRLAGGNDGLNTIIPLDVYSKYKSARAKLAVPEAKVLKPAGVSKWGFHPSLSYMKSLYEEGKLKIIQSVGYPDQDFSHFRSSDIWQTASDADKVVNTGWLGRYLKYEYPNYPNGFPNTTMPDPLAVEVNYSLSLSLQGPITGMGVTIHDTENFYKLLQGVQTPAPNTPAGEQLKYVRLISYLANKYNDSLKNAYEKAKSTPLQLPSGNDLAAKLGVISQLIAGGLKTRIYMVTLDGFDTHKLQADTSDSTKGEHSLLLQTLNDAVASFMANLKQFKIQDRVVGMTFSEFGRRIVENGSGGTDHGAAAPMFVFGNKVLGGILGTSPTLPAVADVEDNIPMQYDFRSVYASVLKDFYCVPDADLQEIFFKNFQTLPIITPSNCAPTSIHEANQEAGEKLLKIYPNPFSEITNISFKTKGGHTSIQIFNNSGKVVAIPVDNYFTEGEQNIYWNSEDLPAGTYYCRFQNGTISQIQSMIKVR